MSPRFIPFILAMVLVTACAKKESSFQRFTVYSETYQKFADFQDLSNLAKVEKLLNDRDSAPIPTEWTIYYLEAETAEGKIFWHYNPDGRLVRLKDGKYLEGYKLHDPKALNQLLSLPNR